MNKIWFFGCSLTYGSGLRAINASLDNRWTKLVADHFGMIEENRGSPGASNEMILQNIRDVYSSIQKDDMVVMQTTFPGRTFAYVEQSDKPVRYNIVNPRPTLNYNLIHHGGKFNGEKFSVFHHNVSKKQFFEHTSETKKLMDDLSHYVADVKLPYIDKWKQHYNGEFWFYKTIFEEKGIKTVFWDFDERYDFETIEQSTKGKIKDYHFSLKGHKDFAQKIIDSLVAS